MPQMKGLEMLKMAREEGRDTETVILSEHGNKDDAVAAIKVGVRDWFEKSSLEMSKLLNKVKELAEGVPLDEIRRILSVIPD
jgi:DNA-binding NarL/FixJ family response regulator